MNQNLKEKNKHLKQLNTSAEKHATSTKPYDPRQAPV